MKQFDLAELGLEHRDVDLHWNRPREILDDDEPSLALPKDARDEKGLYRFVRTHHLQEFDGGTTDRIGIAFDQTLAKRIDQYKPETIHELRSRGRLFLSYSLVGYGGQHRRIVYEDVEHLLCFVVQPIGNVQKVKSLPDGAYYRVESHGSKGDVPRLIEFPALMISEN